MENCLNYNVKKDCSYNSLPFNPRIVSKMLQDSIFKYTLNNQKYVI